MTLKLTNNQSIILGIFFANPDKSFYLRELGRMLKKEPGFFQKDMNNLESDGILTSFFKGKSRFFSLNKSYPLYKEIKSIIFKTTGVENVLSRQLKKITGITQAFIYGSFANGTADNFSDVDIIIIGDPDQGKLDTALRLIEKQFNREINYSLYTPAEFNAKRRSSAFLKGIFRNKRMILI